MNDEARTLASVALEGMTKRMRQVYYEMPDDGSWVTSSQVQEACEAEGYGWQVSSTLYQLREAGLVDVKPDPDRSSRSSMVLYQRQDYVLDPPTPPVSTRDRKPSEQPARFDLEDAPLGQTVGDLLTREVEILQHVIGLMDPLDEAARLRVMMYTMAYYNQGVET